MLLHDLADADGRAGRASRWAVPLLPALTALLVSSLGLSGPSFWRDEAATVSMVRCPVEEMSRVFERLGVVRALGGPPAARTWAQPALGPEGGARWVSGPIPIGALTGNVPMRRNGGCCSPGVTRWRA